VNKADLSKLPEFLQTRRWFAGKAWPIKNIELVDHVELAIDGQNFTLSAIDVTYELGSPERYFLPVMYNGDGKFRDALEDDRLARKLLGLIQDSAELPSGGGVLRGTRTPGSEGLWSSLRPPPSVRRLGVEQTNSSVVFDDQVILKVVRKLEPGHPPELEIGRLLAERGFLHAPPLLGALHMEGAAASMIAIAHRFIPSESDGWGWLTGQWKKQRSLTPEVADALRVLGQRVGELHEILGGEAADPVFSPEPILTEDLQRWSSSIIGELGVVISEGERVLPELGRVRGPLLERAQRLAHLTPEGMKIRVHGDLHLGQTLRASNDWMIFDFEGEPARRFEQRREKQSPLKDVAGMLRSFHYAEAAVELDDGTDDGGRADAAREAFLDGYLSATAQSRLIPRSRETLYGLLDALELEKLIYELRYEIKHRPTWVKIPARTLMKETSGEAAQR
jgi:maltokinase